MSADGELIAEGAELFADIAVDPEPAEYEVTLDTARDVDWWQTSTETSSVWRFTSEHVHGEPAALPMLQVDYELAGLDLYNHADAPTTVRLRPYSLADRNVNGRRDREHHGLLLDRRRGDVGPSSSSGDVGDGWYEGRSPSRRRATRRATSACASRPRTTPATRCQQEITRAYAADYVEPTATPTTTPPTTPPTETPTVPATTTLPGTGGGNVGALAGLGLAVLALGGITVGVARRRLAG